MVIMNFKGLIFMNHWCTAKSTAQSKQRAVSVFVIFTPVQCQQLRDWIRRNNLISKECSFTFLMDEVRVSSNRKLIHYIIPRVMWTKINCQEQLVLPFQIDLKLLQGVLKWLWNSLSLVMAQWIRHIPLVWETWVQFPLGCINQCVPEQNT